MTIRCRTRAVQRQTTAHNLFLKQCSFQFINLVQISLLSAVLAQQVRYFRVFVGYRQLQWSFPLVVLGVDIGLGIHQQFRNILEALRCRAVQRCVAFLCLGH